MEKTKRRILLAIDSGDSSRQAIPVAARIAKLMRSELLVTHVWAPEFSSRTKKWQMEPPSQLTALLATVLDELKALGVGAQSELRAAGPDGVAAEIVAAAKSYGADLIIVGSRGLSDLASLFLGSVSHQVLARSDCPLLVVKGGPGRDEPIRRILLAVADEDEVPAVVEATVDIAAPAKAEVLVLHARYLLPAGMRAAFVEPDEESIALVDTVVRQLREAGVEASNESMLDRYGLAREILDSAKTWNADLIVVGSRRLSDLAALVLGSTAHAVIRRTDRPVLVARRSETRRGKPKPKR